MIRRKAEFLVMGDRIYGTGFHAIHTEQTSSEIDHLIIGRYVNHRSGRTRIAARCAICRAFRCVNPRLASKAVRNRRGTIRVRNGPMALFQPRIYRIDHQHISQVVAAVRQIETFIAERKIGYLLIAHGQRQTEPVMKGRIDNLVM